MRIDRGLLAGLAVVVLWASAFPAIQVAVPELGVIGLSLVRLGTAAAVLVAVGALRGIRLPRAKDLGWIIAAGFFGMTAYQLLLNRTELGVPAGTASIVVAAAPLVSVAVARLLLREAVSHWTVGGSVIAVGGVVAVCLARAGVSLSSSVWFAVAAMVVQGIYHPLQRPLLRRYSGLEVATWTMVAGTLMTLPLAPIGVGRLLTASTAGWAAALYLALLPSALGFALWGVAVGRLPVAVSTSLLYLVPPVAVAIAWLWLGEVPLLSEALGGLGVLAGVAVIAQGPRVGAAIARRRKERLLDPPVSPGSRPRRRGADRSAAPSACRRPGRARRGSPARTPPAPSPR